VAPIQNVSSQGNGDIGLNALLPSRFAPQAFMHKHFQKRLVSNALAASDLSGFGDIRRGQSKCDLHTGCPA
jgi:hypothetical protein